MAPVLNLNNEVVKMRKDVKKARVLTIRRLTRHIGKLKLKKGSEDLKLKNQKRVERLIEEIHAMKEIKPDEVTRLALRTEVNFESVCRKIYTENMFHTNYLRKAIYERLLTLKH